MVLLCKDVVFGESGIMLYQSSNVCCILGAGIEGGVVFDGMVCVDRRVDVHCIDDERGGSDGGSGGGSVVSGKEKKPCAGWYVLLLESGACSL